MNCRPGDLARLVKSSEGNDDKIVHVLRDSGHRDSGDFWWIVKSLCRIHSQGRIYPPGSELFAADSALRPLRDPGEDARDETLLWKPVPSSTKEAA